MEGSTRWMLALAVALALVSVSMAFDGYDGLPRPTGFDLQPTKSYGPDPKVKYENQEANCLWYGWENMHYEKLYTSNCTEQLWKSLSVGANPAGLSAFQYYAPIESHFYDAEYNEYLCGIGCFDLSRTSSVSAPSSSPSSSPIAPASSPTSAEAPGPASVPKAPTPTPVGAPVPGRAPVSAPPARTPVSSPTSPGARAPGPALSTNAGSVLKGCSNSFVVVFVAAILCLLSAH